MARCFVTRRLPGSALERLAEDHDVSVWQGRLPPTPAELAAKRASGRGLADPPHGPHQRRADRRAPTAQGDLQLRRGLRQHRPRGRHQEGHSRRAHARRPDRRDRGPHLRANAGGRPAPAGCDQGSRTGRLGDLGAGHAPRPGGPRRHARDHRLRPYRPRGRGARARLLDARPHRQRPRRPHRRGQEICLHKRTS